MLVCILFLVVLSGAVAREVNTSYFRFRNDRLNRQCEDAVLNKEKNIIEKPVYIILMLIFIVIFLLLLLGVIKGLLGLFVSKQIGEAGLGLFVDLPTHLNQCQEKELKQRPVVYDVAGWPVNPDTRERNVRLLPKRLNFCLNVIFFLAYPLALILKCCAMCCCIREYREGDEKRSFRKLNAIRTHKSKDLVSLGAKVNKYDEEQKEKDDTDYVLNQMNKSQSSLHNNRSTYGE
ncbi:unnamed protein product [Acanthoscelides obtectus]|uniref:Uncharacterized protein n=1 Tax=Acanthoscelides obtectus TaxID=200917 RepID=A0A9P0M7C5_ACAOB|nr:unnamed protein product [Acanthoscelides obtectus]CAH2014630.1 unnamed protein product [Acanthoscelides obtectus]CAK1624192.1 hypothetical protein AOBTE_LOCUS2388 [Acanthoscelides obtectus]CAK1624193.1 hypothetical protein AOBTE_LOCUS2389 [Acanthoscelides obtectus]